MELKRTQETLEVFKMYVLNQSRSILSRKGKNVTSKLFQSLNGTVKEMKNSIFVEFEMEDYAYYQDRGVKGAKSSYPEIGKYGTLAKFGKGTGTKGGLTRGINKWVRARRFQFRDKKTGRFMSYDSTAFLITRSVYNKGIKPSLFFTKPFERAFEKLPDALIEQFGLDVEDFLAYTLKEDRLR